jgi:LuxR family maltose regulon positive regulatory protein
MLADVVRDSTSQPYSSAYAYFILALLTWDGGDHAEAHQLLETCLEKAAPEQVRFPFVDHSDATSIELLASHTAATGFRSFLETCLVASESAAERRIATPGEHLTAREREVLAYLRTPMSSQEIAEQMSVSINTLKTHQRAIYRKLGAANRREAIRIAGR